MTKQSRKRLTTAAILVAVLAAAGYGWMTLQNRGTPEGFVSGNGRIEATEIDLATQLGGRVSELLVDEGDFVEAGQILARMQVDTLTAQHDEARAREQQAASDVDSAVAQVAMRKSDHAAAQAVVGQHKSEVDAASRRFARSRTLASEGASSKQELDDDRASVRSAEAALTAARAQVGAAEAAITAAETQVASARAKVTAATATVARIQTDIDDSDLEAPRAGRVQYVIARPGEVLGAGAKVLNLVDLSDVYMNFFMPQRVAGQLALGSEVRVILDAAPQYVLPAKVSFVASTAQFTPKTVETESEREKLMFRVKAQLDRELLQKYLKHVKTGLPGVAWLRLDSNQPWPDHLQEKVPQ